jgi:hypothetical protein
LAGTGRFESCDGRDLDIRIALDPALQPLSEFAQFHKEISLMLVAVRRSGLRGQAYRANGCGCHRCAHDGGLRASAAEALQSELIGHKFALRREVNRNQQDS